MWNERRIERSGDGDYVLHLPEAERALLRQLPDELRSLRVLSETASAERLTAEQAQAWLTALNDLRLFLGTRLEVSDETLLADLAEDDPGAPELALYAYLSWLQEQLVEALAAELPD